MLVDSGGTNDFYSQPDRGDGIVKSTGSFNSNDPAMSTLQHIGFGRITELGHLDVRASGQDGKPHHWVMTKPVRYERRTRPTTTLFGSTEPGARLFNPLSRSNVNLVTTEKFGDIEVYLEFIIPKGGDSGVYLHGLYDMKCRSMT